ncbi:MAG: toprim domain-containing protein [Deltaproteobacteria bacterium]|nr:toprim domain-containing protein [Deltaproteobacteria bacterium]
MSRNEWIDFAEIRRLVSLEDVIFRLYKIEGLVRTGDKLVGPCPVHQGISPRAFHADLSKNVWKCFSKCQAGGNQLDFVVRREGIDVRAAALKLKHAFIDGHASDRDSSPPEAPKSSTATTSVVTPSTSSTPTKDATIQGPTKSSMERDEREAPEGSEGGGPLSRNAPLTLVLPLTRQHPYLTKDRGLKDETLEHFGVGYCTRGMLRGMVAFPIRNQEGELVAYAGRRLKASEIEKLGKYRFPKNFAKHLELFNLHEAKAHARDRGLILVEGFFAVLALFEAGFPNAVASMGAEVSSVQLELLSQACDVVVLFDGDEAGEKGAEKVAQALASRTKVRVLSLPPDAQPDDLSPRVLRWAINGMQGLDLSSVRFIPRSV